MQIKKGLYFSFKDHEHDYNVVNFDTKLFLLIFFDKKKGSIWSFGFWKWLENSKLPGYLCQAWKKSKISLEYVKKCHTKLEFVTYFQKFV